MQFVEQRQAAVCHEYLLRAQAVERMAKTLVEKASVVNGVNVIKAVLPFEPSAAKDLVFKIREALPENLLCVIGSTANEKPMLSVMLSDDMVSSHDLNAGRWYAKPPASSRVVAVVSPTTPRLVARTSTASLLPWIRSSSWPICKQTSTEYI